MNPLTLALQSNQSKKDLGDPYLSLQLDSQTAAVLPMEHAQEVLVVPVERIVPMPNMPECVLGLLNQRSRVFWAIDLPQMLELQPIDRDVQQYNIAIVRVENVPLGLVVQEVKGVMRLSADALQSPIGAFAPSLTPYLRGWVQQKSDALLVLDAKAIMRSPILHGD